MLSQVGGYRYLLIWHVICVLKPGQSIGSTTSTEVTCSFFLCFRQVLFSVSVRWNLNPGSLLHMNHMMVRRERLDIDYRNCKKMLHSFFSMYCFCKIQSKGRYHCRSCGLVLCGNCFKWRHLFSCFDGSMSQQLHTASFFGLLTIYIYTWTLSGSVRCRSVVAWISLWYRDWYWVIVSAQRCDLVSFTLCLPLRASRLNECCCWPWTCKVLPAIYTSVYTHIYMYIFMIWYSIIWYNLM